MRTEQVNFEGWQNCIRLYNDVSEIVLATGIGPRILRFGFIAGPNAFYIDPLTAGQLGGDDWKIYGGHRLWQAPETFPESYGPDNSAVSVQINTESVTLRQPEDRLTGLVKEVQVSLDEKTGQAEILHRLTNGNSHDVSYAPWAISVMTPGGTAIVPQEPFGEGNDFLLPSRSIALWSYTRMNDSRWEWGDLFIRANQQPGVPGEQKIGMLNRQGWSAYCFDGHCFIKKFPFEQHAVYPDLGCNNEIYFNGDFLEVESLGPMTVIAPGQKVQHVEKWSLEKMDFPFTEGEIISRLIPMLQQMG